MVAWIKIVGLCLLTNYLSNAQNAPIDRVEPPFWWTGMQNSELQIMIYGKDVAEFKPRIESETIELKAIHHGQSRNYLFIDIEMGPDTKPGTLIIDFYKNGHNSFSHPYELKQRSVQLKRFKGFDQSDVLYLITPDRFANGNSENDEIEGLREGLNRGAEYGRHGGDIQGIKDHLDYVDDMGFTAIWLNPVLENDQDQWSYHGYSTTNYYKVDPRFGSNEEYRKFCELAAQKNIGIIMDVIVNHCGSLHWWISDPPFSDWINRQNESYQQTNHRKTTLLDPYSSDYDRKQMVEGWFVPTMPDLNQRNPFMSKYLIQNSIWWIEYCGLNGIRQDTYSYPFKEFMTDWTCAIRDEYPEINIVGEEWTTNPNIIAYWQEGAQNKDGNNSCLPSQMDFPITMALRDALSENEGWGTGLVKIYESLANDFIYPIPENMVIFPDNHDMSRIFTEVGEDMHLLKNAIVFILTTRGIPQLYYGTEILMSNKGSDSHGIIRSDFPGGWEGDETNAFLGTGLSDDAQKVQAFLPCTR